MSSCDVSIRFDREDRIYHPGDSVTGTVCVRADQTVRCNGLVVEHFWQTHGAGTVEHGVVQTQNVFQGDLDADQEYTAPFSFNAPSGPPTYHGKCVNVDHYIRARVDIPWAADPVAEATYHLAPGADNYPQLPVLKDVESQARGLLRMLGLGLGLAFLLVGWLAPFPVLLFLWPLGALAIYLCLRPWLVDWRVGKVRLEAPVRTAAPGEELHIELRFTPRKDCVIRAAHLWLTCDEIAVAGGKEDVTTHTHQVASSLEHFDVHDVDVAAGTPVLLSKTVTIPDTQAYSFQASENQVLWKLEVSIDIAGWADWNQTVPLIVRARPVETTSAPGAVNDGVEPSGAAGE